MARARIWRWVQDITLAGVIGGFALAEIWMPFDSITGAGSPWTTTLGVAFEVPLLAMRRRAPYALAGIPAIWILLAVAAGGHLQVAFWGQMVALCVALYSVARHGTNRQIAIVAGASGLMLVLGDVFLPALRAPDEIAFHWAVCVVVFGGALALRWSESRAVAAAVRAARVEAESRERAVRVVADERTRIARELHDVLGHSVSVMVVQAGAAVGSVHDDPDAAVRALELIRATGAASLAEMRRVVALLRDEDDASLTPQPGVVEIAELVDQARADGLTVELRQTGDPRLPSPGRSLAVYRIVQEALTNVRKHAPTARVVVAVDCAADAVRVVVTDEGDRKASAARATAGHGLVGMRERAILYGGSVRAGPHERGWRVVAEIPEEVPT